MTLVEEALQVIETHQLCHYDPKYLIKIIEGLLQLRGVEQWQKQELMKDKVLG